LSPRDLGPHVVCRRVLIILFYFGEGRNHIAAAVLWLTCSSWVVVTFLHNRDSLIPRSARSGMPLAHPAVLLIEGDGGLQLWKKDRGSDDTKRSLTPTLARSSLFRLVLSCVACRGGLGKLAVSPQVHVHSVNPRGLVAHNVVQHGHWPHCERCERR